MSPSTANSEVAGIARPVLLAANHFDRLAEEPTGDLQLGNAPGLIPAGNFGENRILAEADHHGARFTLRPILFSNQPPMFARRNPDPQRVFIMHANPVGADVGPLAVRVFHDHHAARADISPAVILVPARCRELQQVDLVAIFNIFRNRPIRNFDGPERSLAPELFFPRANDIEAGEFRVETECQCGRRSRTDRIGHDAKTFWESL